MKKVNGLNKFMSQTNDRSSKKLNTPYNEQKSQNNDRSVWYSCDPAAKLLLDQKRSNESPVVNPEKKAHIDLHI